MAQHGVIVDIAVAQARSLPDLVKKLQTTAPDLAESLSGKSLIASKTPWGVIVGYGVAWAVSHYAIGWDEGTTALVSGVVVLLASYAMRSITKGRIVGILSAPAPPADVRQESIATMPPPPLNTNVPRVP